MGFVFKAIGFFVAALVVVGLAKGGLGMLGGTDTPASIPGRINQEFAEVGLSVPAQGGNYGGRQPVPYQSVPQGTDLERQLRERGVFGR
jgi:hypothetical protein